MKERFRRISGYEEYWFLLNPTSTGSDISRSLASRRLVLTCAEASCLKDHLACITKREVNALHKIIWWNVSLSWHPCSLHPLCHVSFTVVGDFLFLDMVNCDCKQSQPLTVVEEIREEALIYLESRAGCTRCLASPVDVECLAYIAIEVPYSD